ncbi:MAG TPA: phosphomannomutase/phosphoglucomutase [Polyangia bacterium]|jgi:phosphomannomutase/phosphoglucomutase
MNDRVFREYDIRGHAERDLPDDFVGDLGRAIATMFVARGATRITVGRDCRLSSPRIHAALTEQLLGAGLDVVDVGIVHTPALYFSVFHLGVEGGVMITASHNPSEDNGFKIVAGRSTIHGAEIQDLLACIKARAFRTTGRPGVGSAHAILPDYIATIVGNVRLGARRPKVIVDGGNGTGGVALMPILKALGIEAEGIFCEPDGRFPNHHPDPTVAENLQALCARVRETGAEVGIALDGDADRIGAVDGQGRIVWGDQLMMLFAREILKDKPGATFVSEVKCSQALFDEIAALGGKAIMWKVGHSLIKVKMREENAALAGEMSGHMFFADRWYGFDDAVYAGARLVELLSRGPATMAQHYDTLPALHNTPEIRLDCPEEIKFEVVRRTVAWFRERHPVVDIDGGRISFQEDGRNVGWGLVRASNTGAVLVLRFEADSAARLSSIRTLVEDRLHQIIAETTASSR